MGIYWEAMLVRMGIYIYGYIMGIYWVCIYIYTYNQWLLLSTDIPGGAAELSGRSSADPRS